MAVVIENDREESVRYQVWKENLHKNEEESIKLGKFQKIDGFNTEIPGFWYYSRDDGKKIKVKINDTEISFTGDAQTAFHLQFSNIHILFYAGVAYKCESDEDVEISKRVSRKVSRKPAMKRMSYFEEVLQELTRQDALKRKSFERANSYIQTESTQSDRSENYMINRKLEILSRRTAVKRPSFYLKHNSRNSSGNSSENIDLSTDNSAFRPNVKTVSRELSIKPNVKVVSREYSTIASADIIQANSSEDLDDKSSFPDPIVQERNSLYESTDETLIQSGEDRKQSVISENTLKKFKKCSPKPKVSKAPSASYGSFQMKREKSLEKFESLREHLKQTIFSTGLGGVGKNRCLGIPAGNKIEMKEAKSLEKLYSLPQQEQPIFKDGMSGVGNGGCLTDDHKLAERLGFQRGFQGGFQVALQAKLDRNNCIKVGNY